MVPAVVYSMCIRLHIRIRLNKNECRLAVPTLSAKRFHIEYWTVSAANDLILYFIVFYRLESRANAGENRESKAEENV